MERLLLLPQLLNSFKIKELQDFMITLTLIRLMKKKLEVSKLMQHVLSMKENQGIMFMLIARIMQTMLKI
jgi:hypothetical protein